KIFKNGNEYSGLAVNLNVIFQVEKGFQWILANE
ncbi:hypothetical protein LCGC14_3043720, partial [marine sediment metagenome]